jgi:hypothetical protein
MIGPEPISAQNGYRVSHDHRAVTVGNEAPVWPSPTPGTATTSSVTSQSDQRDHARLRPVTRFLPAPLTSVALRPPIELRWMRPLVDGAEVDRSGGELRDSEVDRTPENFAPRNWTMPPENVVALKSTVTPENMAPEKSPPSKTTPVRSKSLPTQETAAPSRR